MKKQIVFVMLSAIALSGAMMFSGCSSTEENVEVNPGYDPVTGEVPVQVVFDIATGNTPTTRQSEADVQALTTNTFRGMDETSLLSFKRGTANDGKPVPSAIAADKHYALGTIIGAGVVAPTAEPPKSHRVLELSLPVETNALMFWGKATKGTGSNADSEQGKIEFSPQQALDNSTFSLCKRVPDDETSTYNKTAFAYYQKMLVAILNKIAKVSYSGTIDKIDYTVSWAAYAKDSGTGVSHSLAVNDKDPSDNTEAKPICALGEILGNAYVTMNTIYDNELRAGSGSAVERTLVDLFAVVHSVAEAEPTDTEEKVAKEVGKAIRTELRKYLIDSGTAFLPVSDIKDNLSLGPIPTKETDKLTEFPANFGLPMGATVLTLTMDWETLLPTYSYRTTVPIFGTGGGATDIDSYMFPPELCYFGNSPIRVSDETKEPTDYPDGVDNWDADTSWTSEWTDNGHVTSSTRSVAMKYNINYGTALLKTSVRYGAAKLKDNNYQIQRDHYGTTEANLEIDATAAPFELTGVLIGGQNKTVGWDYLPKLVTGETAFSYTIYDNVLNKAENTSAGTIPGYPITEGSSPTYSLPNYTLVWDNCDTTKLANKEKQNVVYIALEFKNNGDDFWGQNNLIRKGGTFYITGMLDPDNVTVTDKTKEQVAADKSLGITWPTNYALPPYDTDGSTIKQRRVFIQDYMTEANFVIGEYSLQKALVAVPDLRSAQLSVGLSVDVKWSTGLKFDDIILGGDGGGNEPPTP